MFLLLVLANHPFHKYYLMNHVENKLLSFINCFFWVLQLFDHVMVFIVLSNICFHSFFRLGNTLNSTNYNFQACSINPRSVEGLLLKGTLLLELKKLQEAVMHFREAMQIAPHRFEPHKVRYLWQYSL